MSNTAKKAFIYARISTKQQLEGDGFNRQLASCHAWAKRNDWQIAREFTEQQTGSDEFRERKKLSEAMDLCGPKSATGVTAIVVERSDRIARDLIVAELFFRECRTRGILVYAADSGEELVNATGDPTRKLIRQILGALGEWEKSMVIMKLQAGRRRKKLETGKPCGGRLPYDNKEVIAEILRLRFIEGESYGRIARRLTWKRIPTPQGNSIVWGRAAVMKFCHVHGPESKHDLGNQMAIALQTAG